MAYDIVTVRLGGGSRRMQRMQMPSFFWLGCRAVLNPGFLHTAFPAPCSISVYPTVHPGRRRTIIGNL